jgi:hypothetical protein
MVLKHEQEREERNGMRFKHRQPLLSHRFNKENEEDENMDRCEKLYKLRERSE